MKTLLVPLVLLFLWGCEKKLIDYRNKYVGTWEFTCVIADCPPANESKCDTIRSTSTGKIFYNKNHGKGMLYIQFTPERKQQYCIDKHGNFTNCDMEGRFSDTKHLVLVQRTKTECGGQGIGSYTVTGIRKK